MNIYARLPGDAPWPSPLSLAAPQLYARPPAQVCAQAQFPCPCLCAPVRARMRTGPVPHPYRSPERSPPRRLCLPVSGKVMKIVILVDYPQKGDSQASGRRQKGSSKSVGKTGKEPQARGRGKAGKELPACFRQSHEDCISCGLSPERRLTSQWKKAEGELQTVGKTGKEPRRLRGGGREGWVRYLEARCPGIAALAPFLSCHSLGLMPWRASVLASVKEHVESLFPPGRLLERIRGMETARALRQDAGGPFVEGGCPSRLAALEATGCSACSIG